MSSLPESLVQFRSSLEEAIGREQAARVRGRRHRRLAAVGATSLVLVVGTASALATGLLGNGKPHVADSVFPSDGKRGSFTVHILVISDAGELTRSWRIVPEPMGTPSPTGQYVKVSGRGRILRLGGRAQAWHAGIVGFVSRPGETKQRVLITMKGRPEGVFVLSPLQPGFLKRDTGTQKYAGTTG